MVAFVWFYLLYLNIWLLECPNSNLEIQKTFQLFCETNNININYDFFCNNINF